MHNIFKHLQNISIFILSLIFIFTVFPVCSFAEGVTGTDDIDVAELVYYSTYIVDNQLEPLSVTRTLTTRNGKSCYRYNLPATTGEYKAVTCYTVHNFIGNHEYNLKFSYSIGSAGHQTVTCALVFYDANGNELDTQYLYTHDPTTNAWIDVDLNFYADTSGFSTGYTTRLEFVFADSQHGANNYYLADPIYLNDNDDETGFFNSIIEWLQGIYNSLVDGFSDLLTSISNGLSSLGSTITNKLQSVQNSIVSAISGIQQWFVNLGNAIGDFFTMLKNYLLYFQHPVTLNADGVPVDANGDPVYTNPFTDTIQSIKQTIDGLILNLNGFITTIQNVNVQITGYLSTFTSLFERFTGSSGLPIFGIIISLALIIIVIRKILGR